MAETRTYTGGCLCGAVRFEIAGPIRDVVDCHCGQCLRFHGHVAAYTEAPRRQLTMVEDGALRWYASSQRARRGFCGRCGSSLFWERSGGDRIAVAAGSLDPPTGLRTVMHIFTADKADYYEIGDDLEQRPAGRGS